MWLLWLLWLLLAFVQISLERAGALEHVVEVVEDVEAHELIVRTEGRTVGAAHVLLVDVVEHGDLVGLEQTARENAERDRLGCQLDILAEYELLDDAHAQMLYAVAHQIRHAHRGKVRLVHIYPLKQWQPATCPVLCCVVLSLFLVFVFCCCDNMAVV